MRNLCLTLALGLALPAIATETGAPKPLSPAAKPAAVAEAPAVKPAPAAAKALSETASAEKPWQALAEKAAAGDKEAFAEINRAIQEGETEAQEALVAAQNAGVVGPLKARSLKGDLASLQKLLEMRKKKHSQADAALLSVYQSLAPKALEGDDIAASVMELAAKRGDKRAQEAMDKASLARDQALALSGTAKALSPTAQAESLSPSAQAQALSPAAKAEAEAPAALTGEAGVAAKEEAPPADAAKPGETPAEMEAPAGLDAGAPAADDPTMKAPPAEK